MQIGNRNKAYNLILFHPLSAIAVAALSCALVEFGNNHLDYHLSLTGVMMFWIYGISFGILNLYELYGYTIMQFLLFVFLLSRPVIAELYHVEWTYWSDYALAGSLKALLISELAMFIGAYLIKQPERLPAAKLKWKERDHSIIQNALLILLVATGIVCSYSELSHYMIFRDMSYETIYMGAAVSDPLPVRVLTTMFPYAVFAYLATIPNKHRSLLILMAYIILGVPTFLLGNRTSLVLKIAFATMYFFIRDFSRKEGEGPWITRPIKIGFSIFVFFAIAFLGAYNYIRMGTTADNQTFMPLIADFFYKQGTTYDTLCQGFQYESAIRSFPGTISYSFGPVIDSLQHNTLSRLLFGTTDLGSGNSINMVLNSNNLAHRISYIALGEASYLEGHGRGSTFLLETYYDGGYVFVFIYSLILGAFLASFNKLIQKRKWITNTLLLFSASSVMMIPRSSASDFISFIVTPHFWLMMAYLLVAHCFATVDRFNLFKIKLATSETKENN